MNNNESAFTLIEFITIITIMAIIIFIAVPNVNKIIDNARKNAFKDKINTIEKKVQEKCYLEQERQEPITNSYSIENKIISPSINLEGDFPNGNINVDNQCNITYTLSNGKYSGIKENINDKPIISKIN